MIATFLRLLALAIPAVVSTGVAAAPLQGVWGGDRAQLTIEDARARFETDCAGGTIEGRVVPDASGRFDLPGTFESYARTGGPQRADEDARPSPARYSGQLAGDTMTLTIAPAGAEPLQYRLRKGVSVRLVRCL